MQKNNIKKSLFSRIRNNFIAGVVVLIPIGITLYLTLFFIRISSKIIPKELNPNNYLPFNIPGLEIIVALFFVQLGEIAFLTVCKQNLVPKRRLIKNTQHTRQRIRFISV